MVAAFEHELGRPFAVDHAAALQVERPANGARIAGAVARHAARPACHIRSVTLIREPVPPTIITSAWSRRIMSAASASASSDDTSPCGDRVVRAAGVVANADVAGRHVRQILEHPQRIHLAHRLLRPALDVEVLLLDPRLNGSSQLLEFAVQEPGGADHAEAIRVDRRLRPGRRPARPSRPRRRRAESRAT